MRRLTRTLGSVAVAAIAAAVAHAQVSLPGTPLPQAPLPTLPGVTDPVTGTVRTATTTLSEARRLRVRELLRTERATVEHPLRSNTVHTLTRENTGPNVGFRVPIVHWDFVPDWDGLDVKCVPKGSGSENMSFLKMCVPADGVTGIKKFVLESIVGAGGKPCPPGIVGVGIGGTSDLCMHLAKVAATRPLGTTCGDPEGAKIEAELSEAVNELGIGPQGLGGRSTSFRVHVETAATHITMNPVAVNIQCHSARRASAVITPGGIAFK